MTGQDLISAVITYYDSTLASDAENTTRRARVLNNLQMIVDEVWNHRAWSFKFRTAPMAFDGGTCAAPTDYSRLGPEGLLYSLSPRSFYTETFAAEVINRQVAGDTARKVFAVASSASGGQYFIIPDLTSPGPTLTLYYEAAPPAMVDSAAEISEIPASYHRTVLLAGTIARTQIDKNDIRMFYEKQYLLGLGRMVTNDLPLQTRNRQLPMAVGKKSW